MLWMGKCIVLSLRLPVIVLTCHLVILFPILLGALQSSLLFDLIPKPTLVK